MAKEVRCNAWPSVGDIDIDYSVCSCGRVRRFLICRGLDETLSSEFKGIAA